MADNRQGRRAFVAALGGLVASGIKGQVLGDQLVESVPLSTPAVAGKVTLHGDPDYEQHRRAAVWQARKPARYPHLIVQARTEADVTETLRYARAKRMTVSVRGSGHNYSASYLRDGGILLDVSQLRDIEIDAGQRRARVGPGIQAAELAATLGKYDLAFPVAHASTVGLGGYLLGGGMGWHGESWGQFACFNIRAVDVVTAQGERITISSDSHPDLYWAARGAGPAFSAVAVGFYLDLFPLPAAITASARVYSIDALADVTEWLEESALQHDAKVELTLVLENDVQEDVAGIDPEKLCVVSMVCFADDEDEARTVLGKLAEGAPEDGCIDCEAFRPTNFAELLAAGRTSVPRRVAVDTAWVIRRREALLALRSHFKAAPSAHTVVIANYRANPHIAVGEAACSVIAPLFFNCFTSWDQPADDALNLEWMDTAVEVLKPFTVGCYINETDIFRRPDRAQLCFSDESWRRLSAVQEKYDPHGTFAPPFRLQS